MVKDSIGLPQPKAEGGRARLCIWVVDADMMQEQITEVSETESMPKETAPTGDSLSYEELRSRLPKEISDDIVVNFSRKSTSFNRCFQKYKHKRMLMNSTWQYGVNLSLPSGA